VWLTVTWSLAVEEQFYLVSPFLIRRFSEGFLEWFLAGVVVAAPLLRLWVRNHFPAPAGMDFAYVLMPCRADSLAVGMLIALNWRKRGWRDWIHAHSRILAMVLAVLFTGTMVLNFFFSYRYLFLTQIVGHSWLAFFFGGTLLMALARPETGLAALLRTKFLRNWGRISYCVYLIHQVMNAAMHGLLGASDTATNWKTLAAPVLAIPLTYALASLSWKYFEERMLRIGEKYKY
jgi:peptidoglycan/LPS O-acetylase OafA/YrhL